MLHYVRKPVALVAETAREYVPTADHAVIGCLVFMLAISGCRGTGYTGRGALLGGLTGAGLGAAVAESTGGQAESGAVIGSAMGAITGASVGHEMDAHVQAEQIAQQHFDQQMRSAVTLADVVTMSASGLSEQVVEHHIQTYGVNHPGPLTPADLISLSQQGVADRVIQALQTATTSGPPPPTSVVAVPAYPPVVVAAPARPSVHIWGGGRRRRPRVGWGISWGGG